MELTDNEITALKACLNYSDRESQLGDNMSVGGTAEFMDELGWNAQQVGGLISSLEKKGVAYREVDDEVNGVPVDTVWLTELGVNVIFDILEAEEKVEEDAPEDDGLDGMREHLVTMRDESLESARLALVQARAELDRIEETLNEVADGVDKDQVGRLDTIDASAIFAAYGSDKQLREFDKVRAERRAR